MCKYNQKNPSSTRCETNIMRITVLFIIQYAITEVFC